MVDGWTEEGPWLYFKLTNEPKGSGKLKTEDIQMILQLSQCLSSTNICGQNMLLMCNFIFMQHNRHSDKVKSMKF